MANNKTNKTNSYNRKYTGPARQLKCSCGGEAKHKKITNYPFGKKSAGRSTSFYKCKKCGKTFN